MAPPKLSVASLLSSTGGGLTADRRRRVAAYCSTHGLVVQQTTDHAEVALEAVRSRAVDGIVTLRWMDFGSTPEEAATMINSAEQVGAKLYSVDEHLDTDRADGRMARNMILNHGHLTEGSSALAAGERVSFDDFLGRPTTPRDPNARRKAVGYVRVSHYKDEEKIAPHIQIGHIREYCEAHNLDLIDVKADLDLSGRSFKKREKIKASIEMVRDGVADVIVVWKWSRFGRNKRESDLNLGIIENDLGGEVQAATEPADTKTPIGKFTRGFFLQLAEFESDRMGEIWRDVHAHRRGKGYTHNGGERLGYRKIDKYSYEPILANEDGSPGIGAALAECYRRYIAGEGFPALARYLNAQGFTTTLGNQFSSQSLRASMDSGFAAGLVTLTVKEGRTTRQDWVRGDHEALIEPRIFAEYLRERQARAGDPSRRSRSRGDVKHALSGFARCPYCLGSMTAGRTGGENGYAFFQCSRRAGGSTCPGTRISMRKLEAAVFDWLSQSADEIQAERRGARAQTTNIHRGDEKRRQELQSELNELDAEATTLTRKMGRGKLSERDYLASMKSIEVDRSRLRAQIDDIDGRVRASNQKPSTIPLLVEQWSSLDGAEKNQVLRTVLTTIYPYAAHHRGEEERVVIVAQWDTEDPIVAAHERGEVDLPGDHEHSQPASGETKQMILRHLRDYGGSTAAVLAQVTGISEVGTRKHLRELNADGLVFGQAQSSDGTRRRPPKLWQLTSLGSDAINL